MLFVLSYASSDEKSDPSQLAILFLSAAGISHLYRLIFIRLSWPSLKIGKLIPRVIIGSIIAGLVYLIIQLGVALVYNDFLIKKSDFTLIQLISSWLSLSIIYLLWSVFYFTYFFLEKSRNEELNALQMQAKLNEFELYNLKTQLNPHFIFNAMNSIRALIDENPKLARRSLTQLSSILRTTLQMNRSKFVTLDEELRLIKEYLELEKIRFEERLVVNYEIAPGLGHYLVPPMMLQTLVENAIKHGISKYRKGGNVEFRVKENLDSIEVTITNPGDFEEKHNQMGLGVSSTQQRLGILYGEKAGLAIQNKENKVYTIVTFPKKESYENDSN